MQKRLVTIAVFIVLTASCAKSPPGADGLIETRPAILQRNVVQVNSAIGGFYSALPAYYQNTSKLYPLVVFLHGSAEIGDGNADLSRVLVGGGLPEQLAQGIFPPAFTVNGDSYSFIILMPQFNELPKPESIFSFIAYAKQHFRVDAHRIYLAGLSAGGMATSDFGAAHPEAVAAIVPIAGVSMWFDVDTKARNIAQGHLPVWAFHNEDDKVLPLSEVARFIALVNSNNPAVPARLTKLLPFGVFNHDAWTRATDPACRVDGMNMYEWMLQYRR